MQPTLEAVGVGDCEPFKIWAHGYPYHTVRWHFHPELEIHLITATGGRVFVGDYVGEFRPGNLVMTGPNLPHNWLSDVAPGATIAERCIVLQFSQCFSQACAKTFRLPALVDLVLQSERGLEFSEQASLAVAPLMRAMLGAEPLSRPALFFNIIEHLLRDDRRRPLASIGYRSEPIVYMTQPLNHVLDHIRGNLAHELYQSELAELSGYTPSGFSRAFFRKTGMTFKDYVNRLRINQACTMLANSDRPITDVCFEVGFNNVSNFNRRFLKLMQMTPRHYRIHHQENDHPVRKAGAAA